MKLYAVLQIHPTLEGPDGIQLRLPKGDFVIPCFSDYERAKEFAGVKLDILEFEIKYTPEELSFESFARYSVQRIRGKDNRLYGKIHGSDDCDKTLCGKEMNEFWHINTTSGNYRVTCGRCQDVLDKRTKMGVQK